MMIDIRELFDEAPEGFRAKQASKSEILLESFLRGMREEDVQYQMNVWVQIDLDQHETKIRVEGLHSVVDTEKGYYEDWKQFPFQAIYEFRERLLNLKEEVDRRLGVISEITSPDHPDFVPEHFNT